MKIHPYRGSVEAPIRNKEEHCSVAKLYFTNELFTSERSFYDTKHSHKRIKVKIDKNNQAIK